MPARLLGDERLARRAVEGDEAAFAEIYSRYADDLYRFSLAMVGRPQDAQEALHNTMVKALRSLPGEERRIQLKPWLYRIARNESVEILRRRRDSAELEPESAPSTAELTTAVEARERLRELIDDLEQLPERQRAALVMRELAGLDFDAIAESFGTSAAVARQTVYEARLSLRKMEEGREMSCEAVMHELSNRDGRMPRHRALRAHLRHCADCRAFREAISRRNRDFAAIATLPAAASVAVLQGVLGGANAGAATAGAVGGGGGGILGAIGAGAGKAAATSVLVKSATAVAVVTAVGVGADRSGLVDLPVRVGGETDRAPVQQGRPAAGPSDRSAGHRGRADQAETAITTQPGASADDRRGAAQAGTPAADGGSSKGHGNGHRAVSGSGNGKGHGAGRGAGRPEGLPPAASRGQDTAAAHKAPQARPDPGPRTPPVEKAPKAATPPPPSPSPPVERDPVEPSTPGPAAQGVEAGPKRTSSAPEE